MKKKGIIILIIALLAVIVTTIVINKNNQKYIMQDGMMLALSLDGSSITSFPERGAYNIEIDCGNTGKGIWLVEDWKLGVEDITGNVKCNVSFTTNPTTLKSKVETVNASQNYNSHGYRYSGKTPSNWVWFNGEKWRIIGSIPTTISDGTETNLVKIIRNESIGGLAFNSANSNTTWGSNTLYTLLNSYYYGKGNSTGASPCWGHSKAGYALCDYEEIGISNSSTDYYGRMIKEVYWNVGKVSRTSTVISTAYTTEEGTKSSLTGKIGLMSVSDYGYATSGITYSSIGLSSLSSYEQNNWLYGQGYEWTLTPYSTSTVLYADTYGSVYYLPANNGHAVRPVVYLDSSVYIISGEGTESNPYQIGM